MAEPSIHFLSVGSATPLPDRQRLRAGPLALDFLEGDVRYVRLGGREMIRRIYAAVRDRNWGTVPGVISNLRTEIADDTFSLTYTSTHRRNEIHFVWHAAISGAPDGTLRFDFDGLAHTTFLRNRIGWCVLHPIPDCAGARCRAIYADGSTRELTFPETVAAEQPLEGFRDLAGLAHEIRPGLWVQLRFEGDQFETEDQRNWIDASFKTYGTPLHRPFPVEVPEGARIRQSIELQLIESPGSTTTVTGLTFTTPAAEPVTTIQVEWTNPSARLPEMGLGTASTGIPLSPLEIKRLVTLNLTHLRVDVRLGSDDWTARLTIAARDATELGLPLELVVHLSPDPGDDLVRLAHQLRRLRADLARILVLQLGEDSTTPAALQAARRYLADLAAPIGVGTDGDLYQLQLQRPPADADFIAWSMNPQVHATDVASIAETPLAAADQVLAMARAYPGIPLVVSPITLKPRFNPVATGPTASHQAGELPLEVDPRQMSLFGAGWSLAMLAALASTGVESITWFETAGWRGIVETDEGSLDPSLFPSIPGGVFPVYHLFALWAPFAGARVGTVAISQPLRVAALALRRDNRCGVWSANLTGQPCAIRLTGMPGGVILHRLDTRNAFPALRDPETFLTLPGEPTQPTQGAITIELPPFGLLFLASQ